MKHRVKFVGQILQDRVNKCEALQNVEGVAFDYYRGYNNYYRKPINWERRLRRAVKTRIPNQTPEKVVEDLLWTILLSMRDYRTVQTKDGMLEQVPVKIKGYQDALEICIEAYDLFISYDYDEK